MFKQTVNCYFVAINDVEYAIRNACLLQQICQEQSNRWILLAWLQNERVAARNGACKHPHRNHCRKVERRNACHNSEWLTNAVHINASGGLLAVTPLQQVRDTACEFNVLETTGNFTQSISNDLAVFGTQKGSNFISIALHQVANVEHDLSTTRQVRCSPTWQRCSSSGNRGINLLYGCKINSG